MEKARHNSALREEKSDVTRIELAEVCGISPNGIKWHLKQMQEKGLIRRIGPNKGGNWEVIETEK